VTNGIVPDSAGFTPTAAGPYSFQAVYSGDGNDNGAASICSAEQLLVKTNPTIGSTLSATSVDVGSTVRDSATLTGATSDAGLEPVVPDSTTGGRPGRHVLRSAPVPAG
jgi:hypothetical protein